MNKEVSIPAAASFVCKSCNQESDFSWINPVYVIICPNCGAKYNAETGVHEKVKEGQRVSHQPLIPLGTKGYIKGIPYVVSAYCVRKEKGTVYRWDEYVLVNPVYGCAFLSQYNGHWTYLRRASDIYLLGVYYNTVNYKEEEYRLFGRYQSELISAVGAFPYAFDKDQIPYVQEFICPPKMISSEKTDAEYVLYFGEYVQPDEIKSAFNLKKIPSKNGVGAVEPYFSAYSGELYKNILVYLLMLLGVLQLYFSFTAQDKSVFVEGFAINDSTNKKEIITKPFQVEGGVKNLEVKMYGQIDNNWLYSGISLINETTGDMYDLELETEYYHGVSDGESWAEGDLWASKVISQVPSGNYYMVLYPQKPDNLPVANFAISVYRDVGQLTNFFIVLVLILIFPIYQNIKKNNFEIKRWSNSDFSPYEQE